MFRRKLVGLLLGVSLFASTARAQEHGRPTVEMTFARALSLARWQAPSLATARARTAEAHSAVDAASVWRFNPRLQGSAGPRFATSETSLDWSVGALQWLELGGQRGDRMEAARAEADAAEARAGDAERLLLRDVGLAFAQALYWGRRVRLAEENLRIAEEIARVARRRHEVGDVGGLEESVASLSLTRARAGRSRAVVMLARVKGQLKTRLGLDPATEIVVRGDLRRLGLADEPPPANAEVRPDVRALRAAIRGADAEAELGRAHRIPDLALGANYAREESASIIRGGLTVELPLFDHGQGVTAAANARRARIEAALATTRRRAAIEVHTAATASQQLDAAVQQFEQGGLATLERAERVATASYEAGAIPLGQLLSVRHELIQAKLDYAALLLGAARARIELAASAGDL